jgi:hypothetical protein
MPFDMTTTDNTTLVPEGFVPDLSELAEEPSQGAWPTGWYAATIVEGYATRKGTQFVTEDFLSGKGDSRNLRICVQIRNAKGETRNMNQLYNYRFDDLSLERISAIQEARQEFKGVQGKWPGGASDLQRSSLALAKLGAIQKAVGFKLNKTSVGVSVLTLIDQSVDVRLVIDENGYNEIKEIAKAGLKVGRK